MKLHRRIQHKVRSGFSLAELMVVIVIIGLLATLVVPNVVGKLFKGQQGKATADIVSIVNALDAFAIDNNGRFPDSLEELVTPDDDGITYLRRERVPLDPWGNEYRYDPPMAGQSKPRVYSFGADGLPGGDGKDRDLDNLEIENR